MAKTEVTQVLKIEVTYIGSKPVSESDIIKRLKSDDVHIISNKVFEIEK